MAPDDVVSPSWGFYFDFLSPYSYLASQRISDFPAFHALEPRPVVFGSILSARNAQGPGEIQLRRRAGLTDLLLLARHYGIPLEGPPRHPFNSVPALRVTLAVAPDQRRSLVDAFFRAAWARGEDLESFAVLGRILVETDIRDVDPEEASSQPELRKALKTSTKAFLERGGFGVPSFLIRDVLFFGHDRMEVAEAYAKGELDLDRSQLEAMLNRPQPPRLV
ncbi:MAG: 2-hydroxychromene-2-carboxylate isomerase [Myxococcota bacterium]